MLIHKSSTTFFDLATAFFLENKKFGLLELISSTCLELKQLIYLSIPLFNLYNTKYMLDLPYIHS